MLSSKVLVFTVRVWKAQWRGAHVAEGFTRTGVETADGFPA